MKTEEIKQWLNTDDTRSVIYKSTCNQQNEFTPLYTVELHKYSGIVGKSTSVDIEEAELQALINAGEQCKFCKEIIFCKCKPW